VSYSEIDLCVKQVKLKHKLTYAVFIKVKLFGFIRVSCCGMKLNVVADMILNIDQRDQSEITCRVIIRLIVPEIILVQETEIMDCRHVSVTILHITLLLVTILPVIVTTYHLVDAITSCHDLTILTWLLAVMLRGTII